MIDIPEVWFLFGSHIYQCFLDEFPDIVPGIEYIYSVLSESDREKLFLFLQEIQYGEYSWEYKLRVWNESGAQFTVAGKDIDLLYTQVFETIRKLRQ